MAKLKFDRNILLKLDTNNSTSVPSDEVWKGTLLYGSDSSVQYRTISLDSRFSNGISLNVILGGGTQLENVVFTGVVFKVV